MLGVDVAQAFHVELFLRFAERMRRMHTPELAYVKLHQFCREYAGTGDGLPPVSGKRCMET